MVELKDPALAAFLAWLVPGLGHLYQGRRAKAALFFVCIIPTWVFGLYVGGSAELGWGRVVYASWRPGDKRLPYLCQVGVGVAALPALVQAYRVGHGERPLFGGFMAPPSLGSDEFAKNGNRQFHGGFDEMGQPTVNKLHRDLHHYFELGTVYTMIAGLLNILAVYDAWGGPVFTETGGRKKEEEEKEEGPEETSKDDAPPDS